ncbi:MAG: ATP-binding protein [Clostridiaceae bacterium]
MYKFIAAKNNLKKIAKDAAITISLNISTTLLSFLIQHIGLSEVNIVVIYILSVLVTSRYTKGYTYGIAASVFSMLSFNFFFTEPLYTFHVNDSSYIFTLVVMLMAAIFTSALTSKLISLKELASERENQAQILYNITSSLAKTGGVSEVAAVSAQCLSNLLECDITCIVIQPKENTAKKLEVEKASRRIVYNDINISEIEEINGNHYTFPIKVRGKVICFVCLPKKLEMLNDEKQFLLNSVIMQITFAMERELLTSEKETARAETERERFKSSLLRAISHDLRTPLTGITGAAEILLQNLKDEDSIKIVQGIYEDSGWLIRLVENVLSLTRIQEGRLSLNLQPEAVEEIVAEAINRASKYAPNYKILISVPEEVLFIPMDGKLIEQVLINLVDNAIKHTTPSDEINVSVRLDDKKAWFEVSDNGTGIYKDDLPKLFDMFFVSYNSHTDAKRGIGLGLAICKSIVNYHGGEIYAENNSAGGATFRFYLNI